jgi:hypothetical protein
MVVEEEEGGWRHLEWSCWAWCSGSLGAFPAYKAESGLVLRTTQAGVAYRNGRRCQDRRTDGQQDA